MSAKLRRLHGLIESPADAWLACRMAAWALALPVLKRVVRLEALARLLWVGGSRNVAERDVTKIAQLSRLLARRRPPASYDRCYERSLLAYRFLSQRGADPRLVVALRKGDLGGMAGHAWVTVGGRPVDEPDLHEDYEPLVVFGRGGKREA